MQAVSAAELGHVGREPLDGGGGLAVTHDTVLVREPTNRGACSTDGADPFTATIITGGTADGSGDLTVLVSGAAIFEAGINGNFNTVSRAIASADSVTVLGTADTAYRPALAYCEGYVGMGSVVLPKLHATDSSIINYKGSSIRVHRFSDGVSNVNKYRFDILPTFAVFQPSWGMQLFGSA